MVGRCEKLLQINGLGKYYRNRLKIITALIFRNVMKYAKTFNYS